jgi:hypothetical protein
MNVPAPAASKACNNCLQTPGQHVLQLPLVAVFNASLDLKWLMGAAGCADQGFSKRDGAGATGVRHAQLAQSHLANKAAIMTVFLTAWHL